MRKNRYRFASAPPYRGDGGAMNALQGELAEGALANLLQFLALSQAHGCLVVSDAHARQGKVYLEGGRVVYVDASPLRDLPALSWLLSWSEGRFRFRPGVAAPRRTLRDSTESLLLEATQRVDEAAASGRGTPAPLDPDLVLVSPGAGPDEGTVPVSLRALHVWRSLDGARSLRDVARLCRLPLQAVLEGAGELLEHKLVEPANVPLVAEGFVDELTRETVDILGPVGEVVVEDALWELGLSWDALAVSSVDELIDELAAQFRRSEWQRDFLQRAERLRQRYGVSR